MRQCVHARGCRDVRRHGFHQVRVQRDVVRHELPVRDREGRALKELAGRPAALITFLEGLWVRRPGIEHCAGLGDALARFHLAGSDFPMTRANDLSLPGWQSMSV
mgnify:CR=1 FL=1